MDNQIDTYAERLKALLDPIVFDSSTLGALRVIKTHENSINTKPATEINIFGDFDGIENLENRLDKRGYLMTIRFRCLALNREKQAQTDMYYLIDEALNILEDKLCDGSWGNGYLGPSDIKGRAKQFNDNYFTRDIVFPIYLRRTVAN